MPLRWMRLDFFFANSNDPECLFSVPGFDAVAAPGLDPVQKTAGEMHHVMHLFSSLLHGT